MSSFAEDIFRRHFWQLGFAKRFTLQIDSAEFLAALHHPTEDSPYRKYVPPLVGVQPEIENLASYLETLSAAGAERVAQK